MFRSVVSGYFKATLRVVGIESHLPKGSSSKIEQETKQSPGTDDLGTLLAASLMGPVV